MPNLNKRRIVLDQIITQFGYATAWFFVGVAWIIVAGTFAVAMEKTKTALNAYYFVIWKRWIRRKEAQIRSGKVNKG